MKIRWARLLLSAVLTLGLACWAEAQNITATLTGTVTDASGALVPGAAVTVHNNATGLERTAASDAAGAYAVTQIPAGDYKVTVSKSGFQQYVAGNVVLHVGDQRGLNVTLQTGSVSQTVEVTTTAVPIQTATAAQSETITGNQIRQLQLNNRNFEQLVTLQPGVSSSLPALISFGITNTDNISVNGQRAGANNWTVDGGDVNDSGSNLTLLNVPSVDAIQEFKIERSTYDAQYGRSGGGQINVATKSGTNQFHGDAYEFVRNDKLDANDFFLNTAGVKRPPLRYNDFGYTIGGPIKKDKTFFFWSEEWRKQTNPGTAVASLPTQAEMNGDFSNYTQFDSGFGGLDARLAPSGCVNGNQISPNCINANAAAFLKFVYSKYTPNITAGGVNELETATTSQNNFRQEIVRLDHQLTNKVSLFARYMQDNVPTTEPGGLFDGNPLPGLSSTATNAPGRNFVAHMEAVMSPTLVNELGFNYSWGAINSNNTGIIQDPAFYNALQLSGFPFTDAYGRVPSVGFSGGGVGVKQLITGSNNGSAPYHERNIDKELYDNLSWVKGNHTIRVGADGQFMRKSENGPLATNGGFTFRNTNSADYCTPAQAKAGSCLQQTTYMPAFAEFLLGQAEFFSQANRDIIPDLHFTNIEGYVQDDWKVTPRLTLNLGVRYSFLPPAYDVTGTLSAFDPARFNSALAPQIAPCSTNSSGVITGCSEQFAAGQAVTPSTYLNGIIIGTSGASAYGPATTSPYGYYVNQTQKNNWGPRVGFSWDPFGTGTTAVRGGYGIYYDRTLNGIWEQDQFANPPFVNNVSGFDINSGLSFFTPTTAQSLSARSLTSVGTSDWHTPYVQDWNLSVQREILGGTRVEVAYVGSKGTHLLGQFAENIPTLAARAANPTAPVNAVRPYVGFGPIKTRAPIFDSIYHSLQVSANRQVAHGLSLGVAYTWAKNLTDNSADRSGSPMDVYNFALDRGPASFIRPQVLVFNYVYDLPFFGNQEGLIGHTLGGWEISGITTYEDGFPLTFTQSSDPFNSFDFKGCTNCFPDGIGIDPSVISPRPDLTGAISTPHTLSQWVTKSAWSPAIGHYGNSGRGLILSPGLVNWDFSLMKNIKVNERFNAQLRGEFFNVLNHLNPNGPRSTNIDSSVFGQINSDSSWEPRVVQLGLKLNF